MDMVAVLSAVGSFDEIGVVLVRWEKGEIAISWRLDDFLYRMYAFTTQNSYCLELTH